MNVLNFKKSQWQIMFLKIMRKIKCIGCIGYLVLGDMVKNYNNGHILPDIYFTIDTAGVIHIKFYISSAKYFFLSGRNKLP